jgi:hypothetical protein
MRVTCTVRKPAFRTGTPLRQQARNGCKVYAFFKFGKNGADAREAGIYGGLSREDFDKVEMEHYFNYTGRLAIEQTYDSFNKYVDRGTHPVDVILLWAAEEGDLPKVEEVLAAGADPTVKDLNGKTASELAKDEEIKQLIDAAVAKA